MKLIPIKTICLFLSKREKDASHLVESGMPVVRVPGDVKDTPKVLPGAFCKWLAGRTSGQATEEDVRRDLEDFLERGARLAKTKCPGPLARTGAEHAA